MDRVHFIAIIMIALLLVLDAIAIAYILLRKLFVAHAARRSAGIARELVEEFSHSSEVSNLHRNRSRKSRFMLLDQYVEMRQSLKVQHELDAQIRRLLAGLGVERFYTRRLRSRFQFRRIEAAVYLGNLGGENVCTCLERQLKSEKNYLVKLYIAYALCETGAEQSILPMVESLIDAPLWYREKVHLFIEAFSVHLHRVIPELVKRNESELRLLCAHLASTDATSELFKFSKKSLNDSDLSVRRAAARALSRHYPESPECRALLASGDSEMKSYAVEALGKVCTRENARLLLQMLFEIKVLPAVVITLVSMCERSHDILEYLMNRYADPEYLPVQPAIVEILSNRVEYFIVKLQTSERIEARRIIAAMIDNGFVNTVFGFLARNKNREIENDLLAVIQEQAAATTRVMKLARQFLDHRMLKKIGMKPLVPEETVAKHRTTAVRRRKLTVQLGVLLMLFPLIFVLRYRSDIVHWSMVQALTRYVIDANYYLIFYSATISGIYLTILLFSALGAIRQYNYSKVKKRTFLFKKNILPGISVIAPAYNEETGIIESVNSLLNLRYPDHEVIVVNDGSSDHTLNRLIDYFKLEKVDMVVRSDIITRPVRGIYRNSSYPKLTLVDKVNGGKADSLNVGINISGKEYICGIDADSLLSEESLLKIVSTSLDIEIETIAVGGNIFPVNGCRVSHGVLESIGIPKKALANFQFIEYIRAFMAGRIGWSFIDALLIISGAFGLFKRKRVIECGGYLTSSGKFGLDTVGEDMELVVRLTKYMKEHRYPFKVGYSYNANCWTEVPEKLSSLLRQRDRWHRGLIEIFSFHNKMIARTTYGRIGWIALPYFLFFEILGPWIEVQGYLFVIIALLLGILNGQIALLLFITTIMLGVLISISSLIIAEQEVNYFKISEILKLIGFSILENFGFRQLMSMWRIAGYISVLRGTSGWGKMVRQGFASGKKAP